MGPEGPQGIQGEKGDKGDTVDRSPQGATGPRGAIGATAASGPQGAEGVPGNMSIREFFVENVVVPASTAGVAGFFLPLRFNDHVIAIFVAPSAANLNLCYALPVSVGTTEFRMKFTNTSIGTNFYIIRVVSVSAVTTFARIYVFAIPLATARVMEARGIELKNYNAVSQFVYEAN